MKRSILVALFLLPGLSACGGLGQSTSGGVPQGASAPLAPDAGVRDSLGASARLPAAPELADSHYYLYVTNTGNNSITVYNTTASGNTAPVATIAGSNTLLNNPWQLSKDAKGNLYVANKGGSNILVFAHGANGNVAPIRAISGPLTGLSGLYTAIVDQKTEKIFAVANLPPPAAGESQLLRFPLSATGDEAPLATSPGLSSAYQLASDSTGKKLLYASKGVCCTTSTFGVYSVEKFPNAAHPFQLPNIYNFGPTGLADDPTTGTFLVSGNDGVTQGIFRFREDTAGHGAYEYGPPPPPSYSPAVVSVITSDICGGQLALGHDRNIYVAHSTYGSSCAADAVYVYQHDASGNAAPLRVLSGSATQLDQPSGIYVGK
jgi:hypothetical protein